MSRYLVALKTILLACAVYALAIASPSLAGDDNTIAGVLSGDLGCHVYSFESYGGQILFAELLAEFYQSRGRSSGGGCEHDEGSLTETDLVLEGGMGGCGGDGGGGTGGNAGCGCGDSSAGPNDLCLQVVNSLGNKICWAGRPIRPGWQRDPRLACHLTQPDNYFLRVFRGKCGSTTACEAVTESGPPSSSQTYYLLRVRLVDSEDSEGRLFPPAKSR